MVTLGIRGAAFRGAVVAVLLMATTAPSLAGNWLLVTATGCADSVNQVQTYLTSLSETFVTEDAAAAATRTLADLQANFDFVYVAVGSCSTSPLNVPALQASVTGGAIEQWVDAGGVIVLNLAHNDGINYTGPGGSIFHVHQIDGSAQDSPTALDGDHEYLLGTFGGIPLGASDFTNWLTTFHGQVAPPPAFVSSGGVNLGAAPVSGRFNVIVSSSAGSSGVTNGLLEYVLGNGYVLADMMTYDWGSRPPNPSVLTQQLDYLIGIRPNFPVAKPLDHFMFYKRKTTSGAPKVDGFGPVTLADQFGTRDAYVVKPSRLGLPADKNGEGVEDATTHLEEYQITKATPKFAAIPDTRIVNQCNDIELKVVKPFSLLVPTSKDLLGPVPAPDPVDHNVDHFLCYKAKAETPLPKGIQVDVTDQFQTRRYDLQKISKLCNPVAKSGTPSFSSGPNKGAPKPITPAAIDNPLDHLVCYKAKPAKKFIAQTGCGPTVPGDPGVPMPVQAPHTSIVGIHTNNQFGPERHDTIKEVEFCIPSYKNPTCGDGVVNQPSEQCDGTADSGCGGLACLAGCTCTPPSCGDNILNQISEECDGTDDAACEGGCLGDCSCPVCGNGIIEPPLEQCEPTDDSACPGLCTACQCEGALRLVGGFNSMEGRLEVFHAGQWGTVCDDGFDNTDATVACQQLGFSSGVVQCCASFGEGVDPIWMDDLACTGSEPLLVSCPFNGFGNHNCIHGEDVGVVCTP